MVNNTNIYERILSEYRNANNAERTDICEALIDAENLKALLSHLARVCTEKSEHIEGLARQHYAKRWTKTATMLESCANHLPNDPGIGYGV